MNKGSTIKLFTDRIAVAVLKECIQKIVIVAPIARIAFGFSLLVNGIIMRFVAVAAAVALVLLL